MPQSTKDPKGSLIASLLFGLLLTGPTNAKEEKTVGKISFCDTDAQDFKDFSNRLIFVTTLDGKLSAIDALDNGNVKWSINTEPGPLLSSSIHRLELTNNGKWVRMIPSLNGGLYKFDGDSIEAIPITAEDLLRTSFKFSDDLVISGGKETRTYGVSARTGQVLYECSMNGCRNDTSEFQKHGPRKEQEANYVEHNPLFDDVVVVRRQTQTVRAVEPRTGSERWNFSIGHHELEMLKSSDCHGASNVLDPKLLDLEIKVVVPEGIVCAFSRASPNVILWKHKFDQPIVSAWRSTEMTPVEPIDLFNGAEWLWNGHFQAADPSLTPSLYLGMHEKQLYIQESIELQKFYSNKKSAQNLLITDEMNYPRIPWKPYPATSSALAIVKKDQENPIKDEENVPATAISVLYASNYIDGHGFYLYSGKDLNKTKSGLCLDNDTQTIEEQEHVQEDILYFNEPAKVIIVSVWYYWKEIMVIALTTAFILNVMLKLKGDKEIMIVEKHIEVPIPVPMAKEAILEEYPALPKTTPRSLSESNSNNNNNNNNNNGNENYTSRFMGDFDLVQCLGKGGFGVVFEVKNKLDDCHYAIKRVVLPNKQESRDRVMREVRTLANCEHQNIVRYFHAWVETPPPGWQENQDKIWIERNCISTTIDIDTPTASSVPKFILKKPHKMEKKNSLEKWIPHVSLTDDLRAPSISDSFQVEFENPSLKNYDEDEDDDSSFIQFKNPSKDGYESDNESSKSKKDHVISIDHETTDVTESKSINELSKHRRRNLSLNLTSAGSVVSPKANKIYLYIQMQLCQKQSLKEWLSMTDVDTRVDKIIPIFEQIVDAVEYVHLKGLIHRDLKPSNIFFSLDGQIKIGDFGLVTDSSDLQYDLDNNLPIIINQRDKFTRQVGTHLYMSPEQLKGQPYNYKVDIYSLGLVLFELLVCFSTEMERIDVIKDARNSKFPRNFQKNHKDEYELLKLMLSEMPTKRPTTFGIKARPPLKRNNDKSVVNGHVNGSGDELSTRNKQLTPPANIDGSPEWHFELPPRRKDSKSSNLNLTGSHSTASGGSNIGNF